MAEQNIVVYTQTGRSACDSTKEYLNEKGVDYEDRTVNEDEQALKEFTEKYKSRSTTTIVIGDDVIIGFDKGKLDRHIS